MKNLSEKTFRKLCIFSHDTLLFLRIGFRMLEKKKCLNNKKFNIKKV